MLYARSGAQYAAVGDFNGDGKADLAIGGTSGGDSILLGNGDGSFQAPLFFGSIPGLLAGDFNGDGRTDVLTGSGDYGGAGRVAVLLGLGDGSFLPEILSPTGKAAEALYVGDFDGDGVADVAVANGCTHSVGILLGKGDGTFSTEVDYDTQGVVPSSCGAGTAPGSIVSADFNADGVADLAVANIDGSVSVLPGNRDGTFQSAVRYMVGPGAASARLAVAVGDFNGDGIADLVVAGPQGVAVLSGNGDGTFQPPVYYYSGPSRFVLVADLNGDGRDDLAILDGKTGFTVLLGAPPALTSSEVTHTSAPGTLR
jgi:hypothetical protein